MESYNSDNIYEVIVVVRNREIVALRATDLETAISVARVFSTSHRRTTFVRNMKTLDVEVANFWVAPKHARVVAEPMEMAPASR